MAALRTHNNIYLRLVGRLEGGKVREIRVVQVHFGVGVGVEKQNNSLKLAVMLLLLLVKVGWVKN